MARRSQGGEGAAIFLALLVIGAVIVIIQWMLKNFLGIVGFAAGIGGAYLWYQYHESGKSIKFPAIITVVGFILGIAWFTFKEVLNALAFTALLSSLIGIVIAAIFGLRRKAEWKTWLVASFGVFVMAMAFATNAPDIETANPQSEAAIASQETEISNETEASSAQQNEQADKNSEEKVSAKAVPVAAKDTEAQTKPSRIKAKVTNVLDGDTFEISLNGKTEKVRMLLIDTPETRHPDKPVQPFGPEATEFTKSLLAGKEVELERDVSERDKYGRLLFYVYVNGKSVQEQLLEKGLARVSVYPPDVKYVDRYREIQKKAQQAGVGIWSIENYVQEDGYHAEVVKKEEPKPAPLPQPEPQPQPQPEPQPVQEVYFANCSEARAAGAAPIYEGEPGYRLKLDRDRDGVACE
ncbi:hypothetical protein BSNK01_12590 [Bacillaceae bacterium]